MESKIIVKKEEKTDDSIGFYPDRRPIEEYLNNGIINLDKPSGPTSHDVSALVRKVLQIKKVGHGGTLDPAVTGVLPIFLGNGTKIAHLWLRGNKEYVGTLHLHGDLPEKEIRAAALKFIGKITQLPPKRSSVKRVEREREVSSFEIMEIKERDVLFKVSCEHGTYIRRICDDMGKVLKIGAHMTELRRTRAGILTEKKNMFTLQDIKDAYEYWKEDGNEKFIRSIVMPVENGLENLGKVWISDEAINKICHGAKVYAKNIVKLTDGILAGDEIAVLSLKGECVSLARAEMSSKEISQVSEQIAARSERVLMREDLYPAPPKPEVIQ